ncbi:glycosyltransferase family 2 protein [Natronosporangium hydrolyticum]|uniref:glycosyltransferase family 2 protein n=1 Tax=Natronosporangium hydrolyticum TaxID=2811111 RepID=UPI001EFA09CA|nr:glycosyltransferase family 2 protein [Natronosporangium hydrolyticum]
MTSAAVTLTVVVPAFRAEPHLRSCLDSLLTDAPPELTVVVVDDHSPDRTADIAQQYADRDPRVTLLRLPVNVGPGRARNHGLRHARGAFVWFVDADDWLPAGSVPAVLARLTATTPDVLMVDHAEVFPDGRWVGTDPAGALRGDTTPGPLQQRPELLQLAHSACTKIIRRAFLDEIGLRFHPGWYEDSAFNHPLLLAANRIDTLDRVCYCYRQPPGGTITKSISPRHFAAFAQYDRMWTAVAGAGEAYQRFQPELFRLMVDHLLVIAGSGHRVPPSLRRAFFRRLAAEYRLRRPKAGYPIPGGIAGLKHRLVSWGAYEAYATLRWGWRLAGQLRLRGDAPIGSGRRPAPRPQSADLTPR